MHFKRGAAAHYGRFRWLTLGPGDSFGVLGNDRARSALKSRMRVLQPANPSKALASCGKFTGRLYLRVHGAGREIHVPQSCWRRPANKSLARSLSITASTSCPYQKFHPAPIGPDSGVCDMISNDDSDHESPLVNLL